MQNGRSIPYEAVWLNLVGFDNHHWFMTTLFRPVEPEAMKTLRGLLAPGPGVRIKEDA